MKKWLTGLLASLLLPLSLSVPISVHAQGSVNAQGETKQLSRIWDGADILGINADGSVNVSAQGGTFAVTQSGAPWSINVTQFGGTNISTGTGNGGAGIPRVTVSRDSQFQLWDGTNTAAVKAASTAPAATDPALVTALSPNSTGGTNVVWPNAPTGWIPIDAGDSIRAKIWNRAGCQNLTPAGDAVPSAGDCEEYQGGFTFSYMRADANGKPDGTIRQATKIVTVDNDAAAQGAASGGGASWPFGAAAGRGRTVTDADSPGTACAISAISTAELVTSCAHGFTVGTRITLNISGTNSTPVIDGLRSVQIVSSTTYRILDVDVTGAGTAGSHYGSRTLTSATASFTASDVGKTITLSTGGTVCTTSDVPCQGPKFPMGTMYQGMIVGFTNSTTVSVLPTIHTDPAGSGTLKIEPTLLDDTDGLELGRGWLITYKSDLHYWNSETISLAGNKAGIKQGQTFYEVEINRNSLSVGATHPMHGGGQLVADYQTTSHHLPLDGTTHRQKVDYTTGGWIHQVAASFITDRSGTSLGAGEDFQYLCPTNVHCRILSVRAQLAASATAANRVVTLQLDDGGSNISQSIFPILAQTASQTTQYLWGSGVATVAYTPAAGNLQQWAALADPTHMEETWRVGTVTASLQAGDQWSVIIIVVEEWIEE